MHRPRPCRRAWSPVTSRPCSLFRKAEWSCAYTTHSDSNLDCSMPAQPKHLHNSLVHATKESIECHKRNIRNAPINPIPFSEITCGKNAMSSSSFAEYQIAFVLDRKSTYGRSGSDFRRVWSSKNCHDHPPDALSRLGRCAFRNPHITLWRTLLPRRPFWWLASIRCMLQLIVIYTEHNQCNAVNRAA